MRWGRGTYCILLTTDWRIRVALGYFVLCCFLRLLISLVDQEPIPDQFGISWDPLLANLPGQEHNPQKTIRLLVSPKNNHNRLLPFICACAAYLQFNRRHLADMRGRHFSRYEKGPWAMRDPTVWRLHGMACHDKVGQSIGCHSGSVML